jgi:FkbM family methyltransferase
MKTIDGWVCPDLLSGPGNYLGRCAHVELALAHTAKRRVAIQAGGHIGTVPCYLAGRFERVYTFEPDAENFTALAANCHARHPGTIWAARGVLGNKRRPVDLLQSTKSTGQHRVRPDAPGWTPTYRIDDLGLEDVDAIFLDVEGFEIAALTGALVTMDRWRPVIMAEENKRALDFGHRIGDLEAFMAAQAYQRVQGIADDLVFIPLD